LRRKLADAAGAAPSEEEKAQLSLYRSQARTGKNQTPWQLAGGVSQLNVGEGRARGHSLTSRLLTAAFPSSFHHPTSNPSLSFPRASLATFHSHATAILCPPSRCPQVAAYEARLAVSFEQTAAVAAQLAAATEAARQDVSDYHASRRAALRSLRGHATPLWLPLLWADNRAWAGGFLPRMAAVQVKGGKGEVSSEAGHRKPDRGRCP
jgi:hypothetical protein